LSARQAQGELANRAVRGEERTAGEPDRAATYKVVEVSPVGEESLEAALNRWTREGFAFQSLHFVMREGSHRPAMAYLFFSRGSAPAGGS
jgi:hypothetical protein